MNQTLRLSDETFDSHPSLALVLIKALGRTELSINRRPHEPDCSIELILRHSHARGKHVHIQCRHSVFHDVHTVDDTGAEELQGLIGVGPSLEGFDVGFGGNVSSTPLSRQSALSSSAAFTAPTSRWLTGFYYLAHVRAPIIRASSITQTSHWSNERCLRMEPGLHVFPFRSVTYRYTASSQSPFRSTGAGVCAIPILNPLRPRQPASKQKLINIGGAPPRELSRQFNDVGIIRPRTREGAVVH